MVSVPLIEVIDNSSSLRCSLIIRDSPLKTKQKRIAAVQLVGTNFLDIIIIQLVGARNHEFDARSLAFSLVDSSRPRGPLSLCVADPTLGK